VLAILTELLGQLGFGWIASKRWGRLLIYVLAACSFVATVWIVVAALR
jgi:hypothetical protein